MKKRVLVANHREAILALAAEHGLTDVCLFGSVARGDERTDSDVDLFVRRQPGTDPFLLLSFKEELTALLGCKVDVITDHPLMKPRLRENILADAIPLDDGAFAWRGVFHHFRRLGEIDPYFEFGGERGIWSRDKEGI